MGGEEEKIMRVGYQMLLNKRIHRAGKTSTPASLLSSLPSPLPSPLHPSGHSGTFGFVDAGKLPADNGM